LKIFYYAENQSKRHQKLARRGSCFKIVRKWLITSENLGENKEENKSFEKHEI